MKISIFGLGYVGCVGLGCFAQSGHNVVGVDINQNKVDLINEGKPTIIEKDIDKLILSGVKAGRISATTNYLMAVKNTDISLICVGTPSSNEGHLDLNQIYKVSKQIAKGIKEKNGFHVIGIRSTVVPGTNFEIRKIIERISGKKVNIDFTVVSNPEFLREGSAVNDFYNPAVTVIGTDNHKALQMMKDLYKDVKASIEVTDIKVAEIIKYVNNSFHALKISFANEIGNICKKLDIDSHKVMELFCKDTHLNISPIYFKPGYAYGGSCLPKDLKALKTLAHDLYLYSPVIESIEKSNENQKKIAIELIEAKKGESVGLVGLSFKSGTDDLRYSPSVDLAEYLLGKGYKLSIYDKNVSLSNITGTNKQFIQKRIPHLSKLLVDNLDELFERSEIIVITQRNKKLTDLIYNNKNKYIIDLIRISDSLNFNNYEGICY